MVGLRSAGIRVAYAAAAYFWHPPRRVLDAYFEALPDAYHMQRNGPARFEAIRLAIEQQFGGFESLLDVACYEGLVLKYLLEPPDGRRAIGLDISTVALERAKQACAGMDVEFRQFDLNTLYMGSVPSLPVDTPVDVVLVSEVLFHLGPFAHHVWKYPGWHLQRKMRFLRVLQGHARRGVVVQHFGPRERDAIGAVVLRCGGRLVDRDWGVYLLDGTATGTAA